MARPKKVGIKNRCCITPKLLETRCNPEQMKALKQVYHKVRNNIWLAIVDSYDPISRQYYIRLYKRRDARQPAPIPAIRVRPQDIEPFILSKCCPHWLPDDIARILRREAKLEKQAIKEIA